MIEKEAYWSPWLYSTGLVPGSSGGSGGKGMDVLVSTSWAQEMSWAWDLPEFQLLVAVCVSRRRP